MSIQFDTMLVLRGMPGTDIKHYLEESIRVIKEKKIEQCLLAFNGWFFATGTRCVIEEVEALEKRYINYLKS